MRYTAKIACPLETGREWRLPVLAEALRARRSLLTAPAGYVSADSLALAARERFSSVAWLRLDPEDSDPASFLDALESGADAALFVGEPHPERPAAPVRRRDWARAFDTKGQQIAARLPSESAIIIENVHHLVGTESTHKLLGRRLIPALGTEVTVLMTTDRPISPRHFRPVVVFGARDLAVDTSHFVQAAERFHAPLAGVSIRRAMKLTEGRVLALGAILLAASTFGPSVVEHAVQQSRSMGELLVRLGGSLISPAGTEARDGLALAALLGYSNARMFEVVLGSRPSLIEPWLVPLTDDWAQLQALWRAPLLDLLRSQIVSSGDAVRRLADQLVLHGVAEVAIPLYLQVGDVTSAARALPSAVDSLVATGRWDAMSRLLARVPAASQPRGLVAAREAITVADRRPEGRRWGGLTGPVRVRRNASGARHAAPQEDVAWEAVSSSGRTGAAEGPPLTEFHGSPSTSVAERATDASEVVTPGRLTAHLLGSFRRRD